MIMKWETLKLEKKNLPFAGNTSDDSDTETKKRSSPVENTVHAPAASQRSPSFNVGDKPTFAPEWNATSTSASQASGATTPGNGMPQRCLHTMLEQKLRQVGCVAAHREALAARQAAAQSQPCRIERPIPVRPDDIEVCHDSVVEDSEITSGQMTDDFYRNGFESARGLSARGDLDSFKMPMFSPSGEISINDLFPQQNPSEEQGMGLGLGVTDLGYSEDFGMLSALS